MAPNTMTAQRRRVAWQWVFIGCCNCLTYGVVLCGRFRGRTHRPRAHSAPAGQAPGPPASLIEIRKSLERLQRFRGFQRTHFEWVGKQPDPGGVQLSGSAPEGQEKVAGGRRAAETPGQAGSRTAPPEGCQSVGSTTPPGSCRPVTSVPGVSLALNPRLPARITPGCFHRLTSVSSALLAAGGSDPLVRALEHRFGWRTGWDGHEKRR